VPICLWFRVPFLRERLRLAVFSRRSCASCHHVHVPCVHALLSLLTACVIRDAAAASNAAAPLPLPLSTELPSYGSLLGSGCWLQRSVQRLGRPLWL
jgi:hypothetical protein